MQQSGGRDTARQGTILTDVSGIHDVANADFTDDGRGCLVHSPQAVRDHDVAVCINDAGHQITPGGVDDCYSRLGLKVRTDGDDRSRFDQHRCFGEGLSRCCQDSSVLDEYVTSGHDWPGFSVVDRFDRLVAWDWRSLGTGSLRRTRIVRRCQRVRGICRLSGILLRFRVARFDSRQLDGRI